ncbi:hypothetical protein Tco_1043668 [Tanacetum coccineum]|uniref:Uncharacterized protein n=1 Tax=Tanacetum coccineum TaxID=301880 RepID=A0ABQ5GQ99_9ASTR
MQEALCNLNFKRKEASSNKNNKALNKDKEAEDVDVSLFQVTLKTSHHTVKRIFRYLKGQPKLGLWYPKDSPFYLTWKLFWISVTMWCGASLLDREIHNKRSKNPTERNKKAKRTTEISQSSRPIHLVANETVYKEWEDKMERAATTASSLEAEQDSAQIRFEAASKQSNDPPLSRVNTLGSGEDNMKLKELMELFMKLSERILDIKTDRVNWLNLLLSVLVYAARHTLTAVRHKLMLPGITCYSWGMTRHKEVYVTPFHTKKVFANMKRLGKGFSGRVTPLFPTMMIQALEDMSEDSAAPFDSHSTPIISQPSSSKHQKKKSRRKQRKDSTPTEPVTDEAHVSTPSYDPPQSGEDSLQLSELMNLCTSLQEKVLDLEKTKTAQAKEIASLKKRVKQLEKRRKSRTSGLRRLRKVGSSSKVESSIDASLGAQEDASKQGRKIKDLDADAEVTLVNETQEMNDDNLMFDTGVLEEQEIEFEKVVAEPVVSVATTIKSILVSTAEVVTTASASVQIQDELTLAQTLIEIKTAKPKPATTTATTVTYVRPRAKGIIFHDQEEQVHASTKTFASSQSQLP